MIGFLRRHLFIFFISSLRIPFIFLRPLVYQVPSVPTPPSHASSTASIRLLSLMTGIPPLYPL